MPIVFSSYANNANNAALLADQKVYPRRVFATSEPIFYCADGIARRIVRSNDKDIRDANGNVFDHLVISYEPLPRPQFDELSDLDDQDIPDASNAVYDDVPAYNHPEDCDLDSDEEDFLCRQDVFHSNFSYFSDSFPTNTDVSHPAPIAPPATYTLDANENANVEEEEEDEDEDYLFRQDVFHSNFSHFSDSHPTFAATRTTITPVPVTNSYDFDFDFEAIERYCNSDNPEDYDPEHDAMAIRYAIEETMSRYAH